LKPNYLLHKDNILYISIIKTTNKLSTIYLFLVFRLDYKLNYENTNILDSYIFILFIKYSTVKIKSQKIKI